MVYEARQKKNFEISWECVIVTEDETKKYDVGTVDLHHYPRFNLGFCS